MWRRSERRTEQDQEILGRIFKNQRFSLWYIFSAAIQLDHPEMQKHFKFIRCLKANGCKIRNTKLLVYAKDYRGLHAARDIAGGEILMSIPFDMAISCDNLIKETTLGKELSQQKTFDEKWTRFIFPVIYVLEQLKDPGSRYKSWFDIMPEKATDHPMFFTDEEKKWLAGSSTLGIN